MKPDELTGCYTAEMDPKAGPKVLTPTEAAYQRAAGKAMAALQKTPPATPRPDSPIEEWMSEKERRFAEVAARKLAESPVIRRSQTPPQTATRTKDPEIQAPAKAAPLEIVKATAVRASDLPEGLKKAAACPQALANQTAADALTCTKPQPALRAVVRCSQVPRWGQTK
jgi:hypothetical protein